MIKLSHLKNIEINQFEPVAPDIFDLYEFVGMESLLHFGNLIGQIQQITRDIEILAGTAGRIFGKGQISPQIIRDFRMLNSVIDATKNNLLSLKSVVSEEHFNQASKVINTIEKDFQKLQNDFNAGKITVDQFAKGVRESISTIPETLRYLNIAYTEVTDKYQKLRSIMDELSTVPLPDKLVRARFEHISGEINNMINALDQAKSKSGNLIDEEQYTKAKNALKAALYEVNKEINESPTPKINQQMVNSLKNAYTEFLNTINPVRDALASINPEIVNVGENFIKSAEKVNKFSKAFAFIGGVVSSGLGATLMFTERVNAFMMQLGFTLMNLSFGAMGLVMVVSSGFQQALSQIQLQMNQLQQILSELQLRLTRFEIAQSGVMNVFQQYIAPVLQSADAFKQVQLSLQTITGGATSASEVLKELYATAINLPGTFQDLSAIVSSMLSSPVVRSQVKTSEEMKKVLKESILLMQQMALINPKQGVEGALVALQELLGGQTRSIQLRFNLDLSQIEAAVGKSFQSVKGDAIKTIDFLKSFFGKIVPEDLLTSKTKTFTGTVEKVKDIFQAIFVSATDNSYNVLMNFFDKILSSADKTILAVQGRQKELYDFLKNQGLSENQISIEIKNLQDFKNTYNLIKSELTRSTAFLGESLLNALSNIGTALSRPKVAGELGVNVNIDKSLIAKISSVEDPLQKIILTLMLGLNIVINVVTKFVEKLFGTTRSAEETISGIVKGFNNLISVMKRLDPSIISEIISGAARIKELGAVLQVVGARVEEISIKFGMFMAIVNLFSSLLMILSSLLMGLASVVGLLIGVLVTSIGLLTGFSTAILRTITLIRGALTSGMGMFKSFAEAAIAGIKTIGRALFTVFVSANPVGRILMIGAAILSLLGAFKFFGNIIEQVKNVISDAIGGLVNIISKAFGQLVPDSIKKLFSKQEGKGEEDKSQKEKLQDTTKKQASEAGDQITDFYKSHENEIKSVMDGIAKQTMKFLGVDSNVFKGLGFSSGPSKEEIEAKRTKISSKIRSLEEEVSSAFSQFFTIRLGNLIQEYVAKGDLSTLPLEIKSEFLNVLTILSNLSEDLKSESKASLVRIITSSSALKSLLVNIRDTFSNLLRLLSESTAGFKEGLGEIGASAGGRTYSELKSIVLPEESITEKLDQFIEIRMKSLETAIRSTNLVLAYAEEIMKSDYFKPNIGEDFVNKFEEAKKSSEILTVVKDKIQNLLQEYRTKVEELKDLSDKESILSIYENVLENIFGKNIIGFDIISRSLKLEKLSSTFGLVEKEGEIYSEVKKFSNNIKNVVGLISVIGDILKVNITDVDNKIKNLYGVLEEGKTNIAKDILSSVNAFDRLKNSIIFQINKISSEISEIGNLAKDAGMKISSSTTIKEKSKKLYNINETTDKSQNIEISPVNLPPPTNKPKKKSQDIKSLPPLQDVLNQFEGADFQKIIEAFTDKTSIRSKKEQNQVVYRIPPVEIQSKGNITGTDINQIVLSVLAGYKAGAFEAFSLIKNEEKETENIKKEESPKKQKPEDIYNELVNKIPSLNIFFKYLGDEFKNVINNPDVFIKSLDTYLSRFNNQGINTEFIKIANKSKEFAMSPEYYVAEFYGKYVEIQQAELKKANELLLNIYRLLYSNNINQELALDLISKFTNDIVKNRGIIEGSRMTLDLETKAMEEEFKKTAGLIGESLYTFLIQPVLDITKSFSKSFTDTLVSVILEEKPSSLAYRELAHKIVRSTLEKIIGTFFDEAISVMTNLYKQQGFNAQNYIKQIFSGESIKPTIDIQSQGVSNYQQSAESIQSSIVNQQSYISYVQSSAVNTQQLLGNLNNLQYQLRSLNNFQSSLGNLQTPSKTLTNFEYQYTPQTSTVASSFQVPNVMQASNSIAASTVSSEEAAQQMGTVAGQQIAQQITSSFNILMGGVGGMFTGFMFYNMFDELREYYKRRGEDGKATIAMLGQILSVLFMFLNLFITLIALQAIIAAKPLAEGGILPGRFIPLTPFAEGGIIPGRFKEIQAFAEGALVTKPTLGLVAEAGYSEAIIPLKRGYIPVKIQQPKSVTNVFQEVKMPNIPSAVRPLYSSEGYKEESNNGITIINVTDRNELSSITKQESVKNSDIIYNTVSYESEKTREFYYFRTI